MAFKKAKKAKKSKKKTVDREWDHEGGFKAVDSSAATGQEDPTQNKRQRRETQDRDERLRRGLAKIEYAKSNRLKVKKMKDGIKFLDTVQDELSSGKLATAVPQAKEPHIQFKSSKSIIERLETMVSKSCSTNPFVAPHQKELSSLLLKPTNATRAEESSADDEDAVSEIDNKKEVMKSVTKIPDYYDWFFNSSLETKKLEDQKPYTELCETSGYSVHHKLHDYCDASKLPYTKCIGWSNIPGVHKMWQSRFDEEFPATTQKLLPYLLTYGDTFFDGCNYKNIDQYESLLSVHVAQHIIRARALMQKNNERLKKKKTRNILKQKITVSKKRKLVEDTNVEEESLNNLLPSDSDEDVIFERSIGFDKEKMQDEEDVAGVADQGYTRPRILLLCPFRSSARRLILGLIDSLGRENTSVGGLDKFNEEFGNPHSESDEEDSGSDDEGKSKSSKPPPKPNDWKAIFHDNTDDDFKMGIQITPSQGKGSGINKGANVRLYSDFYLSDIIVASPLGLKLVVSGKENLSFDFLSSLEVIILHQCDVLYMQNWDHVTDIIKEVNLTPKVNHDTDFQRVRPYFLDSTSADHRQLIITSELNDPLIWNLFRSKGSSMIGQIRFKHIWSEVGCLGNVTSRVKQMFQMIPCSDPAQQEAVRFDFFKKNILGPILRLKQSKTLIVTPSYFSYVKVRNELIKSEYSRESEISRGRSRFYHGHKSILLYSGRAHFFRRFMIRGAKHIIFYSLPEYAHFYAELVNLLRESDDISESISCTVLFTKYEKMALERIVGPQRCNHMLSSSKTMFMFY